MITMEIKRILKEGVVISAHPLALDADRRFDERRQRTLTRYYLDAGAGGLAVAVHTTQFEIHDPKVGLLKPVLELAVEEIKQFEQRHQKSIVKIAGIIGKTEQAVAEAERAAELGYQAGLLGMSAFCDSSNDEMIAHCERVAGVMPIMGFYLQTAAGGRRLDFEFWRRFAEIENVVAIKIAPFDRYKTLDVIRGVAESGRADEIALYTGNDDNIIADLLTRYKILADGKEIELRIVGGLLGHWAVWTKRAVEQLDQIKKIRKQNRPVPQDILTLNAQVTDCNAAFFDAAHQFKGSIVGIHEVLWRQGLLEGNWTLNPADQLSDHQKNEIDRVYAAYPHLNDDQFVKENIDKWLR